MAVLSTAPDLAARDDAIRINSYTTVLRRAGVPHEVFATYWRDVHGPLCSRIPGLAWYVQHHFNREQDAHLWPQVDGVAPFPNYVLDGGVEIGFADSDDQATFKAASHILFSDEQNMFQETAAYDLPHGSITLVDRLVDPVPNGTDTFDRMHVHLHARHADTNGFNAFAKDGLASILATAPGVLKVRLHLPDAHDNAEASPPAPDVEHTEPPERVRMAMLELVFESPLARRSVFASKAALATLGDQQHHLRYASPFGVSGIYTYVRDKQLTTAALRGSRAAELIRRLGALNQISPEVTHLMQFGSPKA